MAIPRDIVAESDFLGNLMKEKMNMTKTRKNQILSIILCFVLIAAMALMTSGCSNNAAEQAEKVFTFTVVDAAGVETTQTVQTNKETVGEALLEKGLIAGEEGAYGLYVKTVNGETHEFEVDGKYWAFYIDGAYAASGVDKTPITEGATYTFKVE